MSIRVIAGSAKGRRLKMVPGESTRPIMDRVKEALFSILGRDILDAAFLDLFAGTGSVGIEALSRGAAHATFIDLDARAVQTIRDNLEMTRLSARALVRRADAFALLRQPPDRHYDFIYVAPPQYQGLWHKTLEALETYPAWLADDTAVIVQIDPEEWQPPALTRLVVADERRYGNTLLVFMESQPTSTSQPSEE